MSCIPWRLFVGILCLVTFSGCGSSPTGSNGKPAKTGEGSESKPSNEREPVKTEGNLVRVTGEQLAEDYEANKDKANDKYRYGGKILEVDATVKNISPNNGYVYFHAKRGMQL